MGFCLLDCDLTTGFCLCNCGLTMGLCLTNGSHTSDFCLFDGLGGLIPILAPGDVSISCQFSLAGVQGGLSHEQLLQSLIHLPLQSKHLIRQASWTGPGGIETVDWRRCWLCPEVLIL